MGKIIITRMDEVLKTLEVEKNIVAVLSIEHPGSSENGKGAPRLSGMTQEILNFWDSETPVKDGPDIAQVEKGIAFSLSWLPEGDVIIHCHAGKSRSVGIALGVLAFQNPDKSENDLIDMLLEIRPIAAPNIIVVEMVDQLAGRGGKLLQAVKDHPVLTEQRLKTEENRKAALARNPELAKKIFPEKFPKP